MLEWMNVKEICPMCGAVNFLEGKNIREGYAYVEGMEDKTYKLLWYVCKCGKWNVLQIDDRKTLEDLKELKMMTVKAFKLNQAGSKIPKRMKNRKDKLTGRIMRRRHDINKRLYGKTVKLLEGGTEILVDKEVCDMI